MTDDRPRADNAPRRLNYDLIDDEGNVTRTTITEREAIEIGRAIANRRPYVLGTSGAPEPAGVGEDGVLVEETGPGELFVYEEPEEELGELGGATGEDPDER